MHKIHYEKNRVLLDGAESSGDLEPTGPAETGKDLTDEIRTKALELGAGEVGFTKLDRKYVYTSKKRWVKYQHAICLALEQNYEQTQKIANIEAEYATSAPTRRLESSAWNWSIASAHWVTALRCTVPATRPWYTYPFCKRRTWPAGSERAAPVATLRVQMPAGNCHNECTHDLRQAVGLWNPQILPNM